MMVMTKPFGASVAEAKEGLNFSTTQVLPARDTPSYKQRVLPMGPHLLPDCGTITQSNRAEEAS